MSASAIAASSLVMSRQLVPTKSTTPPLLLSSCYEDDLITNHEPFITDVVAESGTWTMMKDIEDGLSDDK